MIKLWGQETIAITETRPEEKQLDAQVLARQAQLALDVSKYVIME